MVIVLQAQLRGKLSRNEEDSEDLLTSNVFGSLKYVPKEAGIVPILSLVKNIDGDPLKLDAVADIKYDFWPWIERVKGHGCEPDVLIIAKQSNNNKVMILVESKYFSGKSNSENSEEEAERYMIHDQLAREWDNLIIEAETKDAIPVLLYVTADFSFPKREIEESVEDFKAQRPSAQTMNIYWTSWRFIQDLLSKSDYDILKDVAEVLRKQGLKLYSGITIIRSLKIGWKFDALESRLLWKYAPLKITWRFEK